MEFRSTKPSLCYEERGGELRVIFFVLDEFRIKNCLQSHLEVEQQLVWSGFLRSAPPPVLEAAVNF